MNGEGSQRRRAEGMSALAQRLPGQRTPPDPSVEQPNAADLTYGWHHAASSSSSLADGGDDDGSAASDDEPFVDFDDEDRPGRQGGDVGPLSPGWAFWGRKAHQQEHTAPRPPTPPQEEEDHTQADSFVCRICFDGPGSLGEGGESLGKLIAPCRCRGTMKFVHQGCLTRWRATSQRQASVMQCDQCGAPYRFRKSRFVGLATNKLLLMGFSVYLFVSLVWFVGFTAERVMRHYDDGDATSTQHKSSGSAAQSTAWWAPWRTSDAGRAAAPPPSSFASRLYQSINLDRTDDTYYDDDPYYRYDYRYTYSEPAAYYTLVKAAIKYVGSGRALQHLTGRGDAAEIVAHQSEQVIVGDSDDGARDEMGWWATLVDDWKHGRGGIWEGQRPVEAEGESPEPALSDAPAAVPDEAPILPNDKDNDGTRESGKTPHAERYDARTAQPLDKDEQPIRPVTRKRHPADANVGKSEAKKGTFVERLILQLSLGASLVGMSSFLTILLGVSTWAPFHLNLGLGRGFARVARRRARGSGGGGGGGGGEGEALVAVFLLFLVFVGIIRALFAVYALTKYVSKRLLTRVEDAILDWGAEEEEQDGQMPRDAAAAAPPATEVDRFRDDAAAPHWLAAARRWPRIQWQTLRQRRRQARNPAAGAAQAL